MEFLLKSVKMHILSVRFYKYLNNISIEVLTGFPGVSNKRKIGNIRNKVHILFNQLQGGNFYTPDQCTNLL